MNQSNPTFDTFIFDLDGTLLDTMPDLIVVTNKTLEHFGKPTHTDAEILSYVGDGAQRLIYRAMPEGTSDETCAEALAYWKALNSPSRTRTCPKRLRSSKSKVASWPFFPTSTRAA